MTAAADDWVKAAMADDAIVVHLLVTLHNTPPPPPGRPALPLQWTVRQRRSKPLSLFSKRPPPHRARASPTTPLSWSAAANSEDSTPPTACKFSTTARSKMIVDGEKKASKRLRKKTLPELKEEEISLTKERRELKRELVALRKNLETLRATNKMLKRMKLELRPCLESTSFQASSISGPESSICHTTRNPAVPPILDEDTIVESSMALPDLNIPFDE